MIKGDAKSVAAGFNPITNPSVQELDQKVMIANTVNNVVVVIIAELDQLRADLAEIVEEIRLHLSVAHYLRHSLVKRVPSSRRAIMRRFGYTYRRNRAENSPESPNPDEDLDIDLDEELPTRPRDGEQDPRETRNPTPQPSRMTVSHHKR